MSEELGDCFVVAFKLVLDHEEYTLCHGTVVRHTDGLHHGHAWCEYTITHDVPVHGTTDTMPMSLTLAVDKSNGLDVTLPAALYRRAGEVYDVAEYDQVTAAAHALRTKHYGPWEEL